VQPTAEILNISGAKLVAGPQ